MKKNYQFVPVINSLPLLSICRPERFVLIFNSKSKRFMLILKGTFWPILHLILQNKKGFLNLSPRSNPHHVQWADAIPRRKSAGRCSVLASPILSQPTPFPSAAEQGTANPSKRHQEIPTRRITHPTGELQSKTIDRELHKSLDTRELTGFSYFNTKLLFPVTRLRQTRNGTHRKSWAIACYQELLKPK